MRRRHLLGWTALAGTAPTLAQGFQTKPVKIIGPAPPGGTADIFARALDQRMQAAMNQPVVVEYKPGAATNFGTDFVAKSAPDGCTLLMNGITLATNPALFAKLPFNPATNDHVGSTLPLGFVTCRRRFNSCRRAGSRPSERRRARRSIGLVRQELA